MFNFLKKTFKKITKEEKKESKDEVKKKKDIKGETKLKKLEDKKEKPKRKIFSRQISEKELESFKFDLFRANISIEVAEKIVESLKEEKSKDAKTVLKNEIQRLLEQEEHDFMNFVKNKTKEQGYCTIVFFGFNGSGKTTTIARLGNLLKKQNIPVVFAAADTFRAAAIEQISKHGENLGLKVVKHKYGSNPAAVVFDAKIHAKSIGGAVLVDTAGRLHADRNLMEELKKIIRINEPDYKILVLDSLTGNDILEQVDKFSEVGFDGLILTKLDVNEKGGSIISVKQKTKKPILFLGTGQEYKDLEKFNSKKVVERLFG